jgi:hypothetical protein
MSGKEHYLKVGNLRYCLEVPVCKKCGGSMHPGKAIAETFTGIPDFIGSDGVVTVSPGGQGKLIDCMKCSSCGWSVTEGEKHV